jgi:hypothetical protein
MKTTVELTAENAAALAKYPALPELSGSFCKQARVTENPRVGGSIPPLAITLMRLGICGEKGFEKRSVLKGTPKNSFDRTESALWETNPSEQ